MTDSLSPALAVFIVLIAAGALLTYWMTRGEAVAGSTEPKGDQQASRDSTADVDLRNAQGVQIGDGNTQESYFGPDRRR